MSGPARSISGRGEEFFNNNSSSHASPFSFESSFSESSSKITKARVPAYLVLENGLIFEGTSCGALGEAGGEIVFNTAMTGYQEILTDPSYRGQIVVMTYPLIGNTGINFEDIESHRPWVEGFVVREMAHLHSSWRAKESLQAYLIKNGIPAIEGIDTRRLVKMIREGGAQRALLTTEASDPETLRKRVKEIPSIVGIDLASSVTCSQPYFFDEGDYIWPGGYVRKKSQKFKVVVLDFGVKRNILRQFVTNGAKVLVVPAGTSAEEIISLNPDGLLLSNGPGDPEPLLKAIATIKKLVGRLPIFGICLGHQLLALALGGRTYKLKFGHHGANHPVKNLITKEVEITSQNHGFAVDASSLPRGATLTHINLNDGTVEGLAYPELMAFSVQYHPESSPGPHDARYLFNQFFDLMKEFKQAHAQKN